MEVPLRKLIKTSAGWIHTTLLLAILIPFLYALCVQDQTAVGSYLYLKCLIILFPVIATDLAADRCRSLLAYLLLCTLIFAATGVLGWTLAGALRAGMLFWGYLLLLLCETLFVIISRLTARLQKKKDQDAAFGADPSFQPFSDLLKEPAFPALFYFGGVYVIAVNFNSPSVCNMALFSAVLYTVITFLYQYVTESERYLSLNKRTCHLPSRRIYGIGSGMLAIYLLLLMILVLPSLLTIPHRHYRDLRELTADLEITYPEFMPEEQTDAQGEDFMAALMAEYDPAAPPPWWLDFIFYLFTSLISFLLILLLLKKIYTVFQDFRTAKDENGDVIEELQDTVEDSQKITLSVRRRRSSEKEQIRKQYRRLIRRHRKDRPAVYESPTEIEANAGIHHTEETMDLHRRYELARYGQEETSIYKKESTFRN